LPVNDDSFQLKNAMSDSLVQEIRETHAAMPRVDVQDAVKAIDRIALLTGGIDKPYALGITAALTTEGISLDFIGSDQVDSPELHGDARIRFLNLRGDQDPRAGMAGKIARIFKYYFRLIGYAATARPRIFHILWNNKFQVFDRVALMLYYRLLGKKIVFTAHNVNAGKRDGNDSWLNRVSLRAQYALAHHVFVHTERMKEELTGEFGVPSTKATVIPFGINNTLPNTALTPAAAKQALGLEPNHKTLLFFGRITPYKGLEYLLEAFEQLVAKDSNYRLVIGGTIKDCQDYWNALQPAIARFGDKVLQRIEFIPDDRVEIFFKAADVFVLPYTDVFQSGVLFLGYSFGLPVIVADVGSLRESIVPGKTGFTCSPRSGADLARAVEEYFSSDVYRNLDERRRDIRAYADERHSWKKVANMTLRVYSQLLTSDTR
jgi:glycosyltransferase involved in cell wall biosynthesis